MQKQYNLYIYFKNSLIEVLHKADTNSICFNSGVDLDGLLEEIEQNFFKLTKRKNEINIPDLFYEFKFGKIYFKFEDSFCNFIEQLLKYFIIEEYIELNQENNSKISDLIKIEKKIKVNNSSDFILNVKIFEEKNPLFSNKNIIFLSNPNGGKTKYIKDNIEDKGYPFYELNFNNLDNPVEYKKELFYHNHQGELIIGNIIKAIVNATFNPNIPHFIFADEIGQFTLNYIFGTTLKSIMKTKQRVDLNKLLTENEGKESFRNIFDLLNKNIDSITFEDFIKLCKEIKEQYNQNYSFTTYTDNGVSLDLFLPNNLYIICCSNYEEGIIESLDDNLGWNELGDRFKTIHFYNFLFKEDNNMKITTNENKNIEVIDNFNQQFQNICLNKKDIQLSQETKTTLKENEYTQLSQETKTILKENEYTLYISNYFNLSDNDEKDNKFKKMKDLLNKKLENMYIETNDIKQILKNLKL